VHGVEGTSMDVKRIGRIFGWFFIGTFITSIPARILFVNGVGASWTDMRFVPGAGSETSLKLGAILEFGLIVTQIATAVVIYPLVRRQSETVALGYEWAFLFGPGLVAGIGNGLMLGYLMYRSALVPPRMALLGLIGGPLLILSFLLTLFDVYDNGSAFSGLLALPEIAWEASLGIYAAWKGFRTDSPIARPQMATA